MRELLMFLTFFSKFQKPNEQAKSLFYTIQHDTTEFR